MRESGPVNSTWIGFCEPLLKSSCTTYSAPTRRDIFSRSSTAISLAERLRVLRLPISTYTRPPLALTELLVSLVSGKVRASTAAASSFRREYSMLLDDGVRTLIIRLPESEAGRKLVPPCVACRAMAPTRLPKAITAIQRR
ncbi:hypothetical protein D3C81_1233640 [compost metagenome]